MPLFPNAQENAAIQATLTPGTTYWMSLHSASPGQTGANELSGGGYGRQSIVFGNASAGQMLNTTGQAFTGLLSSMSVLYWGIWSTVTTGTYEGGGPTGATYGAATTWELDFAIGAVAWQATS